MAKTPVSDEELQLKKKARRRLVGAVVLVLLVVVFVPMFLDRAPRPQKQDIDVRIPPIPGQAQTPPSQPATPPVLPPAALEPAPAPTPTPAAPPEKPTAVPPINPPVAADTATPPASSPAPEPRETPAAADVARKPDTKSADVMRKPDTKSAESFVIQVGAFSDPVNARHLVEKLKAEKVPAYTESVKTPQGDKTRVRAGPYSTMAAAERGRNRLKTLKLSSGDAKIVHKGE